MCKSKKHTIRKKDEILGQIIDSWRFLQTCLIIDHEIFKKNLLFPTDTVSINNIIEFPKDSITASRNSYYDGQLRFSNIALYLTLRETFSATTEAFKINGYVVMLKEADKLDNQYKHFKWIVKFCRNVLSHTYFSGKIPLRKSDYEGLQQKYQESEFAGTPLTFDYDVNKVEDHPFMLDTRISIMIDFESIQEGDNFIDIITLNQMIQLAELCGTFAEYWESRKVRKLFKKKS